MGYQYEWVVRVENTDFSGRIHTPEAVKNLATGLEDMMTDVGYSPKEAVEEGIVYPIAHVEIDYLTPIRLGDTVLVTLNPEPRTTSVNVAFDAELEGEQAFTGELTTVFVEDDSSTAVEPPDHVRANLAELGEE